MTFFPFCIQNVYMSTQAVVYKPLGIRATPEQHRILTDAAAREHRSVNSFVLRAALQAAEAEAPTRARRSLAELREIVEAAQAEFRAANPTGRDPVEELIAERREAAANE